MSSSDRAAAIAHRCLAGETVDLRDHADTLAERQALHFDLQRIGRSQGLVCDGRGRWKLRAEGLASSNDRPCGLDDECDLRRQLAT